MKKYWAIFIRDFKITCTYKTQILSQFIMPFFQIFIQTFIWKSIYDNNKGVNGYTFVQMLTYIIAANLIATLFSISHSFRMSKMIRKGTLSFVLVRPYNYLGESFATFLGSKAIDFFILLLIMIFLNGFGIISIGKISFLGSILIILNLIMFFIFTSFIGSLSFYLIQMWTMKPLFNAFVGLFGGLYFPLDILPTKIFNVLKFNPFNSMSFVNTKVLLNQLSTNEILFYIKASIIWSILFFILFCISWRNGLKKFEGMGV